MVVLPGKRDQILHKDGYKITLSRIHLKPCERDKLKFLDGKTEVLSGTRPEKWQRKY